MKKIILSLLLCLFMSLCFAQNDNVLTEDLQEILNQKNNDLIDINILLKSQMPTEHLTHLNVKSDSKEVRREIVINELKKFSQQQQESVMAVINAETRSNNVTDVKSHWLVNSINCKASRDVIYTLASHPDIKHIDYNKEEKMFQGEDQELREQGAGSRGSVSSMTDNITHVQAEKVWDLGYTGKGVIVAVIDSGVNLDHVDLKDHLWDGGSEYPYHGYNFVNPGQAPYDDKGHGTHCAGTICGDGTSGLATGIAPDATLMCLKTSSKTETSTTFDRLSSAIEFAVEHGADIISISVGGWINDNVARASFRQIFDNALNLGVITSAAAGNNRQYLTTTLPAPRNINSPSDCPPPWIHPDQQGNGTNVSGVVSVGGVNYENQVISISSQGPTTWQETSYADYPHNPGIGLIRPDIVAPGDGIKSLDYETNDGYAIKSGTSMAAPCVAGVMALMLEKNPELTPADICRIIETTATELTPTKSNDYGSGCINALAAVQAVNFDVAGSYLKQYSFTKNFEALSSNANQNLEITLVNNGTQATTATTNVTLTSNDAYVTVVNGNASINNSIAVGGTATCNFTIKINTLSPDNHIAELTVNAGSNSFNIEINISNEFVAPSNVTTEVQNLRNVYLSWNATNNATGYKIYRDGVYIGETSTTSYTDENLDYGTLYTYTITTKRGELETEHSREIRVQTADNPEAPSPTNIVATDNNSSVAISWNNSTGSKGSNIYRKDNIAGTETQIASNVNGDSYTDNISLQEGIYQYGVANLHSEKETIYEEGFENNGTSLPEGWSVYRVGADQNNWGVKASQTTNNTEFTPYMGQYAAFSFYGVNNYDIKFYLVTSSFDLSEYQGSDVTLSFYYITPAWGTDVNNLNVLIGSSPTGPWNAIWTSNRTNVTGWHKAEVDITSYIGSTFYIAFENEIGYGFCSAVDNISIAIDGNKESRIEWSDNIYKNVNVFAQDGDMNNGDNWATNSTPSASDNVIIDANAVVNGTVEVNSLTINEGASLTLNAGAKLIVNGDFVNTDADAFIINDGAQVIQDNEDVAATFNMNIVNPTEWSSNNKTGWQFISSPVKDAKINDFIPQSSDYDLYRYDGTKNLEWINHKDENDYGDDDEPEIPVTPTVPEAPVVTAEALSASSLLFSWDAVDGATSYNVYSAGNLIAEEITVTSYTANYLYYPNTEYCFSFSAVNEAGESAKTEACATTLNAKPITPYDFTATATGESTIELSWSLANRATSYNVYQGNDKIATVTETTYTVEGLEPETTYCFTVTAENEVGESDKTEEKCAKTEESIPDAPVVTATATSHNEILLSWEAVKGATKYNIYSAGFHIDETTETNYTVTPVAANTETCIIVRAANSKGESGDAEACATTKPYAPTNLMATAKGTLSIKLSWADSNNGVTYNIYQGSSLIVENITDRSFTVEGLEKSTEYCFTVKAVNEVSGESSASNEACATTKEQDDEPGTIQESITVGNGGSTTTVLPFTTSYAYSISQQIYTFEDVEQTGNITGIAFQYKSGASGTRSIDVYMKHSDKETFATATSWESMTNEYKVYSGDIVISGTADEWVGVTFTTPFSYTGGNFVLCVYDHTNSTLGGTTFHADQVSGKSLYYYPWMSPAPLDPSNVNKNGYTSNYRNNIKLSFAEGGQDPVTPTVPAAPVVTAEAAGTSSITLTWNAVAGATSYKVYSAGTEIAEVLTTSHTVGYLQAGTNYCFSVSAVNTEGESEKSEACAMTKPSAPTNLVATANGTSSISLSWNISTNATSYNVYQEGIAEPIATGLISTNHTVEGLNSNTEYCFTVTAVNTGGESSESDNACATTDGSAGGIETITIGEGSTASTAYIPVYCSYGPRAFSYSQQIYLASEMQNKTGQITHISFEKAAGTKNHQRSLDIYIDNTEKDHFEGTTDWHLITTEPVFTGTVSLGLSSGTITIKLDRPFNYTGNNIVISIVDNTGYSASDNWGEFDKFKSYSTTTNRTIYTTSKLDIHTGFGEGANYSLQGYTLTSNNQIQLTFDSSSKSATREVSSVSPSRGAFESAFQQGVGYMASYEKENTAVFKGNLNHEKSYVFPVSYNSEKDLANFHLLGNPFSFNMKWSNVTATNLASGYAVVNETGGYTYRGAADDEIAVGDGFFVKATSENPSISYSEGRTLRNEKSQSINVVITGNAGSDNVVVNLGKAGEEGFPKLKNFNEEITTIFVYNNDKSYGIYNCEEEVEEVPIYLNNTNGMGKYTISIDAKGDFENITLVDLVSGDETNMLVHDYNFTASQQENTKRFILKFVEKQQTTDNSNFVYQSGEELIVNTQGTVQIIDIVGRVVYNNVVLNESERINISGFTTGTYIVRVISDKDVMTQKVVVY